MEAMATTARSSMACLYTRVRKRVLFLVACCCLIGPSAFPQESKKQIQWKKKYNTASAVASAEFRPILIYFTSENCAWCNALEKTTFADQDVIAAIPPFVPVRIKIEENREFAALFGVRGTPTIIFLSSVPFTA